MRAKFGRGPTVVSKKGSLKFISRYAYCLVDNPGLWLIHYIGNEDIYVPIPHGNKVRDTNGYRRTCPSVLKAIKTAVTSQTQAKIYKDMVTANTIPTQQGILNPRNTRQVTNMRHSVSAAKRLSKDDIYNLIQLAYHMPETIWKVELYPDLACVVGVKELMDELNVLLETKSGTLLGYGTTFKLGDFYVSILVFRHAVFNESPVIPVAFLIHDRKFQKSARAFL